LRRILLIAKRDYLAVVRTKAFLVGLVLAPLLFGGGFIGIAFMRGKPELGDKRIALIDRTGALAAAVIQVAEEKNAREVFDKKTGQQIGPRYVLEAVKAEDDAGAQRLALSDRVRRGEIAAFLEIGPRTLHPGEDATARRVAYYTNASGLDEMSRWISDPINTGLRRVRMAELGIDAKRTGELLSTPSLERMSLVDRDRNTGAIRAASKKSEVETVVVPMAMMLLLGMIIMVGAAPMLPAITEDKRERVIEMLLGSATPFELMMGKVLSAVGVSLTSSSFYVAGGTLALSGMGMLGLAPLQLLPWFYVYLVADVVMLCAMAAALGAATSDPRDAQSLHVVLIGPVIIPYFMMVPLMRSPNGLAMTVMSLIPPFTPMIMLMRQATPGGVPAWQPWVGLVGIVAWTLAAVWAASRIFRIGILIQGKTPKLAELARWAIRG
jgi:ABC-2 type transport system permease protein